MKLYDQMLEMLEAEPRARERRNKRRAVARILQKRYPVLKEISVDTLIEVLDDGDSLDRYWRLILAEREDLQGSDYRTKKIVEERKEIELGYQGGFHSLVKQAKML